MRWSPLPSLKTAAQLLLLAMMESAWIIALVALLVAVTDSAATGLPLGAAAVVGCWWGAALPTALLRRWRPALLYLLSLLLVAVALYIGLALRFAEVNPLLLLGLAADRSASALAVMVGLAGVRGLLGGAYMGRGNEGLADGKLFSRFRLGLIMLGLVIVAAVVLEAASGGSLLTQQIGGQILSFLVFALISLAWANLDEATLEAGQRAAQSSAPRRITWLMGIGAVVVLVVIMGGLLGGVADSPIGVLFQIISSIAVAIAIAFSFVVGAIAGLIVPVINFLINAARGLANLPNPFKPAPRNAPKNGLNLDNIFDSLKDLNAEENTRTLAYWLVAIGLIILGLWLFTILAVRRLIAEPKSSRPSNTTRVRFGSWSLFWQQLRDWLRALWIALLKRLGLWHEPVTVGVGELGQYSGAEAQRLLDIRQVYRRFQKVAARAGQPRSPQITPREFLNQLQAAYPTIPFAATALTATYTAARYGNRAPTPQQVEAANRALTTVEGFFAKNEGLNLVASKFEQ